MTMPTQRTAVLVTAGPADFVKQRDEDGLVVCDSITDSYLFVHRQPRSARPHELDLRTYKESF